MYNIKLKTVELELGSLYHISYGTLKKYAIGRFIKVTPTGYNFLIGNSKCLLKKLLYPIKNRTDLSFFITENMFINKGNEKPINNSETYLQYKNRKTAVNEKYSWEEWLRNI